MLKEKLKKFIVPQFGKKFLIMITGIFFMGFFLSFLIEISLGTDPYTFQNSVISRRIGWQFGTWQLLLNIILLVIMAVFNRHLIGIGTIANMVLIGYVSDFFRWVWGKIFPKLAEICTDPSLLHAKIILFAVTLLLFVISAAFYINADMGLSPYDGLAYIIGHKLKKIPQAVSRILYDLSVIGIGLLASIGSGFDIKTALIGSFAMAFTLGPAIQIVGAFVNKKILRVQPEQRPDPQEKQQNLTQNLSD